MNKKHIATAALLAAGSVLANAVVYDTTFTNTSSNTDVSNLTVNVTNGVTATLDSLMFSSSATSTDYSTSGSLKTGTNLTNLLAPNVNVANAGQWQATLSYSGFTSDWTFTGIELDTLGFTGQGAWQNKGLDNSTEISDKNINFTVEYKLGTDGSWTQIGSTTAIGMASPDATSTGGTSTGRQTLFSVSGDAVTVNSTDTLQVRISTSLADYTSGTFAGLRTVSLIPEPSAFGLLAGLGALALVASRRRRCK